MRAAIASSRLAGFPPLNPACRRSMQVAAARPAAYYPHVWFNSDAPLAWRLRADHHARRAAAGRGRLRRGNPARSGHRRAGWCRSTPSTPRSTALKQGAASIVDRGSDAGAGWPPQEALRARAARARCYQSGLSHDAVDVARSRALAGAIAAPQLRLLRLVQWLLRQRLAAEWSEFVLGDLEEEYHRRLRRSAFDAVAWLLRQAAVCLLWSTPTERPRGGAFHGRRIGLSPGHLFRGVWRTFRARPLLIASCVAILAAGIGSATAVAAAATASSCGPAASSLRSARFRLRPARGLRSIRHLAARATPSSPVWRHSSNWSRPAADRRRCAPAAMPCARRRPR